MSIRHAAVALSAAACFSAMACSRPAESPRWPGGTLVDLSHEYSDQTVFWPTADRFKLEKVADGMTPQGYYYAANNFATSEHGGTHLDAPVHFAKGHWSVEQIPLDRLTGDAVVVDVTAASGRQPDYRAATGDFQMEGHTAIEAWSEPNAWRSPLLVDARAPFPCRERPVQRCAFV